LKYSRDEKSQIRLDKIIAWMIEMDLCILDNKLRAKGCARYFDLWTRNQAITDWMK
jgi:hypothetical protein